MVPTADQCGIFTLSRTRTSTRWPAVIQCWGGKTRLVEFMLSMRRRTPIGCCRVLNRCSSTFTDEPIFLGADSDIEADLSKNRAGGRLCQKDEAAIGERDKIQALLDQHRPLRHEVKLDMLFDVRFLAKLALAFGYKTLGSHFGQLQYTERLRSLLWTRRIALPSVQHEVRMMSYFTGLHEKSAMQILACPLAFVFVLSALKEGLVLSVVFPSGHSVQVSITDPTVDADVLPLVRDFQDRVFISVPQARKTIGPIRLDEYTARKVARHKIAELDDLMGSICDRKTLPPLR